MKTEKVKELSTIERFFYFVKERESIRLKKESGRPKPWTDDPILQTTRFCNVRRMDDKVSFWLLKNWYEPYHNHHNMLYATALARFFNKPEALELITRLVFTNKHPDWEQIKWELRKRKSEGNTVFNGAYMVRGLDGVDKIECVVDHYVKPLFPLTKGLPTSSMSEACNSISEYYGMGSFMAGQVVADLRHAMKGKWLDRHTWAPIGPGSKRGMNRYLHRNINDGLSQEEFLSHLLRIMEVGKKKLPITLTNRLEAHDWQNCFCEFDKYERILDGGRGKQKYPGDKS